MVIFKIDTLDVRFGAVHPVRGISMDVFANEILTVIGPSNSGKTTFIRSLNRMNDLQTNFRMSGSVELEGKNIRKMEVGALRQKVGMVFALPLPLPLSIYDNVAYGPRMHGLRGGTRLSERVEEALRSAYLWDEVKDRLPESAFKLSGGQQQRLCIARTLAVQPEVILMDEPCSALDPLATTKIEDLIRELKQTYTIIIVTHNMQQAARISDYTALLYLGALVEFDTTDTIFTAPKKKETEDYVTGRFG